jgi:hypothetical protein
VAAERTAGEANAHGMRVFLCPPVSRNLFDIGGPQQTKGYELVSARNNPMNLREKQAFLTDKGRALVYQIERSI